MSNRKGKVPVVSEPSWLCSLQCGDRIVKEQTFLFPLPNPQNAFACIGLYLSKRFHPICIVSLPLAPKDAALKQHSVCQLSHSAV